MSSQKMSYREQLLHPNWQRKRLEVMQRDEFSCQCCYDKESTLHVHHKQYVKGRLAWEYANEELVTLCENCHSVMHDELEILRDVVSRLDVDGPRSISQASAFLAGWASDLNPELASIRDSSPYIFLIGEIASRIEDHFPIGLCDELNQALKKTPYWVVRSIISDAVKAMHERRDDQPPPSICLFVEGEI